MKWTLFWDMHSGGRTKEEPYERIYIEAPKEEAKIIFYNRFGHNPERVTCICCGEDYSISEDESLEQLSGFDRNCHWAYTDKSGKEVTREKAWTPQNGLKKGYASGYIERTDSLKLKIRKENRTPDSSDWGLYIPIE